MRQALFEYAVLVHPTKEEEKEGKNTVLEKRDVVLGSNQQAVLLSIAQGLDSDLAGKIAQGLVDIAVRPF